MAMEVNGYHNYAAKTAGSESTTSTQKVSGAGQNGSSGEVRQYKNADEYAEALKQKFSYFNTTTYVQGVPMTVTVSPAFLKKCLKDPAKADFLEQNLSVLPDCTKSTIEYTKTMQGNPVMTYAAFVFDDKGNIAMMSGCTNDPDGKIARENAQKRAKEQREQEEALEKKRAERKAEKERLARQAAEHRALQKALREEAAEEAAKRKMGETRAAGKAAPETVTANEFTVYGNDVRSMAGKMVQAVNGFGNSAAAASAAVGFDRMA